MKTRNMKLGLNVNLLVCYKQHIMDPDLLSFHHMNFNIQHAVEEEVGNTLKIPYP